MTIVMGLFRFWENAANAVDMLTTQGYKPEDVSVIMLDDVDTEHAGSGGLKGVPTAPNFMNDPNSGLSVQRPLPLPGMPHIVGTGPVITRSPLHFETRDPRDESTRDDLDRGDRPLRNETVGDERGGGIDQGPLYARTDTGEGVPGAGQQYRPDDKQDLLNILVGLDVPREMAEVYAEGVKRGGILVAVDAEDGAQVRNHMLQANAANVDALRSEWAASGWHGYESTEPDRLYPLWGRRR